MRKLLAVVGYSCAMYEGVSLNTPTICTSAKDVLTTSLDKYFLASWNAAGCTKVKQSYTNLPLQIKFAETETETRKIAWRRALAQGSNIINYFGADTHVRSASICQGWDLTSEYARTLQQPNMMNAAGTSYCFRASRRPIFSQAPVLPQLSLIFFSWMIV